MPFFGSPSNFRYIISSIDQAASMDCGGDVIAITAKVALKYGDYVYLDPLSGKAAKTLESSLYPAYGLGVVVGGDVTNYLATDDISLIDTTVASAGAIAIVLVRGIGYGIVDTVSNPVSIGTQITAGPTTAGRIIGENPNSYVTTNPQLVIKQAGATVVKNEVAAPIIISGLAGTAIVADTDSDAFVGTVTNATYNVFVVRSTGNADNTVAMGTAGATLAAVVWPTAAAASVATWGFIIIHPTGTGDFVGGTTALDDATVIPNAVYGNIYARKPVLGYALSTGGAAGAAQKIYIP